jgi:hypothetical protein
MRECPFALYLLSYLCVLLVGAVNYERKVPGQPNFNRSLVSLDEQDLRNLSTVSSQFLVAIRFIGPLALDPEPSPTAALRCEIFSRITLPSLIAATNNAPARTKMKIIFINSSEILEPTCKRVVQKSKNMLGRRLYFSNSTLTYMEHADLDHDLLFFARLDTDDSFGPDVCVEIHRQFIQSSLPIAILSPFYGNLWYPTAGDSDCGDMIYNINIKLYPVIQTTAIYKSSFKKIIGIDDDEDLLKWLSDYPGMRVLPYHFEHPKPEQAFDSIRHVIGRDWDCRRATDCMLYYNTWAQNGVPGMIYTQTGIQSSLARKGWINTTHLKWYDHYERDDSKPNVCKALQYFSIDKWQIINLRQKFLQYGGNLTLSGLAAGPARTNLTQGMEGWTGM